MPGTRTASSVTIDMRTVQPVQGITEAYQQTLKQAGIELEILPGDGKQTLTKYRARTHDMYIGQWGADYWDPHTNADTFARNPDNSDSAKTKPLAWRNAWDVPELTEKTKAALLERDNDKRAAMYKELQQAALDTSHVRADLPADRGCRPARQRQELQARTELRFELRRST